MNLITAQRIWNQISQTELQSLKEDFVSKAVRYAHVRAAWFLLPKDVRLEKDTERTTAHNAFIDTCNILSRNMAKAGEDNSWRAILGDDRKEIGDFACWLHAILAISMR